METVVSYLVYTVISITVAVWVARSLSTNGRLFLVDSFHGNEPLADSVNHLLVVGFYLINIGFVLLALRYGAKPHDLQSAIEILSTKIGLVLAVLGIMHFFNMYVITQMRRRTVGKVAEARGATAKAAKTAKARKKTPSKTNPYLLQEPKGAAKSQPA